MSEDSMSEVCEALISLGRTEIMLEQMEALVTKGERLLGWAEGERDE